VTSKLAEVAPKRAAPWVKTERREVMCVSNDLVQKAAKNFEVLKVFTCVVFDFTFLQYFRFEVFRQTGSIVNLGETLGHVQSGKH
jgi:hypothetical protein